MGQQQSSFQRNTRQRVEAYGPDQNFNSNNNNNQNGQSNWQHHNTNNDNRRSWRGQNQGGGRPPHQPSQQHQPHQPQQHLPTYNSAATAEYNPLQPQLYTPTSPHRQQQPQHQPQQFHPTTLQHPSSLYPLSSLAPSQTPMYPQYYPPGYGAYPTSYPSYGLYQVHLPLPLTTPHSHVFPIATTWIRDVSSIPSLWPTPYDPYGIPSASRCRGSRFTTRHSGSTTRPSRCLHSAYGTSRL